MRARMLKPSLAAHRWPLVSSRRSLTTTVLTVLTAMAAAGCTTPWFATDDDAAAKAKFQELLTAPEPPAFIREATHPYGLTYAKIEGVAAVNGLWGTGGLAEPSPLRDQLIKEMRTDNVPNPDLFLEYDTTAMVHVAAMMPPGARRGDPLDLVVTTPPGSRATSLRSGWLMPARLREIQMIRNAARRSDVQAIANGPVLIRSLYEAGDESAMRREGRVLGGGLCHRDRRLGLMIRPEYQHVMLSSRLAKAINGRFFFFDGTTRRGIATAREDDFIELELHPRYRRNPQRLLSVVGAVAAKEYPGGLQTQLSDLVRKLSEPTTAADAALQLEAIGDDGVPALVAALDHPKQEIRFYAAEALAYLDRIESIEPLEALARDVPAFRYPALAAMEGLEQQLAAEALRRLTNQQSNEVRFGAFLALRERPDRDLLVPGQKLGDGFHLYQLPSTASPLIAVRLSERPEIVIFGGPCPVTPPKHLLTDSGLVIRGDEAGRLRLSRFLPGQPDQQTVVPANVATLIHGIAAVGGNFGDCIEVLRKLKDEGNLPDRLALDPRPQGLRTYHRQSSEGGELTTSDSLPPQDITPAPEPKPAYAWLDPRTWWRK